MNFLIVTHVIHLQHEGQYYGYGPYIREMNLWIKGLDRVTVVGFLAKDQQPSHIDLPYEHPNLRLVSLPYFEVTSVIKAIKAIPTVVLACYRLIIAMASASQIHLRCPGNVGLVGSIAQVLFPWKKKTAKYAGNWDWESKQPWSYRLQQKILRSTILTHNMQVLVYGEWPDRNRNILPFFTASYWAKEIVPVEKTPLKNGIKLCFVGTITENKRADIPLKTCHALNATGQLASVTYCGDGLLRPKLEKHAKELGLEGKAHFLGKVDKATVTQVLQESHFLVFISRSEGWPKAVAEAMFWGCVPITTCVSCVPQMIGSKGERGTIVQNPTHDEVARIIVEYASSPKEYSQTSRSSMDWSRQYTLDKFEQEIKQLL